MKGWHRESARHSLAARGLKTRYNGPHKSAGRDVRIIPGKFGKIWRGYELPPTYELSVRGVGSFLEPPNHPRYQTQHIFTQYGNSPPDNQPSLYYNGDGYSELEDIDKTYKPSVYGSDMVKLWEEDLYAYFRNCYSKDGVTRDVNVAVIEKDPHVYGNDHHLAYLSVKKHYPNAEPRIDLIKNPPPWGVERDKIYGKRSAR